MATADLHTHSFYSDGTESPRRLLELAKAAGLSALAVTDHDTMDGYAEAVAAASELGVELIPGIEMSASYEKCEVHVLGLLLNPSNEALRRFLAEQKERRVQRVHEMVRRLQQMGVSITAEDIFAIGGNKGTVGRLHVAQALVKRGYISKPEEAFDRYIGPKNPAFVPGSPMPPETVIQMIRQADGLPVLAHPVYLKSDDWIDLFARQGLVGVEVYHSSHTPEVIQRYERIADRLGLLKTGGTDFHGSAKEGVPIGAVAVPYALVDSLKAWKRAHLTS